MEYKNYTIKKRKYIFFFIAVMSSFGILHTNVSAQTKNNLLTKEYYSGELRKLRSDVNTSILCNEINKAYDCANSPFFPEGVLSSYAEGKIDKIWKGSPFKVKLNGSLVHVSRLRVVSDMAYGNMTLVFSAGGLIIDISVDYDISKVENNSCCTELCHLYSSDYTGNVQKPREGFQHCFSEHRLPGKYSRKPKSVEASIFCGYNVLVGEKDGGLSFEASIGYRMNRIFSLNMAVGHSRFLVGYEGEDPGNFNKQCTSIRCFALIRPFAGILTEIGVSRSFGDLVGYGASLGAGYQFFGHFAVLGRYSYYGNFRQSMLDFSLGYIF